MKNKTKRFWILEGCILLLFLLSLPWVFTAPTRQVLSADLYYRQSDPDIRSQLFWAEDGSFSAEHCSDGVREGNVVQFELPLHPQQLDALRFDPSNTEAVYSITHIGLMINDTYVRTITTNELYEKCVPVNAKLAVSGEELVITPSNTDSGLLLDSQQVRDSVLEASAALRTRQIRQRFFLTLFFALGLMIFTACAKDFRHYFCSLFQKDEDGTFDWFTLLATAVMAGALLVVLLIGLFSELGLHPDEWDVKACLDYGMTHFLPPDMRDPAVGFTYSGYGYTKLENYTWYFQLAGKIALLVKAMCYGVAYWRIPNLLLFLILAVIFVRNVKKRNWLMIALGICVQVWYIYSYTTADALDFFLAFLSVYQLSCEDSLLYRTVTAERINRKSLPGFLLLGLMFGMLALGKQNYLATLGLVFCVLVIRMLSQKDKALRSRLFRNYWVIVGVFLAVFLFRASFDLIYYGTEKAAVKEAVAIQYADPDKNPLTPSEDLNPSWHLYERGFALSAVFEENPEWFSMHFKSFCGLVDDRDTGLWYYAAMGALYAAILLSIGIATFRKKDNFWGRTAFGCGILLMLGGFAASVLNSYLIDSQPQGRYLLSYVLIAAYLASRVPELLQKRYFRAILIAAGVLSVGYFGLVGMPKFF